MNPSSVLSNRHLASQWPNDVQFRINCHLPTRGARRQEEHVSIKASWLLETETSTPVHGRMGKGKSECQRISVRLTVRIRGKQWDFYCSSIIIKCNWSCSLFNLFLFHFLVACSILRSVHTRPPTQIFLWSYLLLLLTSDKDKDNEFWLGKCRELIAHGRTRNEISPISLFKMHDDLINCGRHNDNIEIIARLIMILQNPE